MSDLHVPPSEEPYFDRQAETMPRPSIESAQLELLLETIELAYARSPLVRETWEAASVKPADICSLDDFRAQVPFISKDDVRRFRDERGDAFGGLACVEPSELTAILSTSGTTGDPTLAPQRWGGPPAGRPALMFRDFWAMGLRPGDFVSMFLFTFRGPAFSAVQMLGAVPILLDYDSLEIERLLRLSLRYRPSVLYNFGGTMIKATAEVAARCGIDPCDAFSSYRGVVWAGEPLGPRARAQAERWGIELYEHSNIGDVTACFECPAHDGMHVWEDTVLIEGITPEAADHRDAVQVTEDGARSELVATALVDRVAPLVRYRSDDIVRIDRRPCRCGRTHARVRTVGRTGDEVVVEGRSILPVDVWEAVESVPACGLGLFQVIRPARNLDVLSLRVGYRAGPGVEPAGVRDAVAGAVLEAVGLMPAVELVPDEELLKLGPPHKIPRVSRR